jgi:hypothetical protein
MKRAAAVLAIIILACAGTTRRRIATAPPAPDAVTQLEGRLVGASAIHVRYHMESTGVMTSVVKGELHSTDGATTVSAYGTLGGTNTRDTHLNPDGVSSELRKALLVDLARVGLHSDLTGLLWDQKVLEQNATKATNVTFDTVERKLAFDLVSAGKTIGSAEVWLTVEGLPLRRVQTIRSSAGETRVEERYLWL